MDESESIVNQIFSETIRDDLITNYNRLQEFIIKPAHKVLFFDAFMTDSSLELIKIKNNSFKQTKIYLNSYFDVSKKRTFNFTNHKTLFYDKLKDRLDGGENIVIVLGNDEEEIIGFLKRYFDVDSAENEFFCKYSSSTGNVKKKELNNVIENWAKYRVVLFTSTVGAGVNFDDKGNVHFNRVM